MAINLWKANHTNHNSVPLAAFEPSPRSLDNPLEPLGANIVWQNLIHDSLFIDKSMCNQELGRSGETGTVRGIILSLDCMAPWMSMVSRSSMGVHGVLVSMDVHGCPWMSVDIHIPSPGRRTV